MGAHERRGEASDDSCPISRVGEDAPLYPLDVRGLSQLLGGRANPTATFSPLVYREAAHVLHF